MIQVTAEGFSKVWGHEPIFKNYALLRNVAAQQLKQALKNCSKSSEEAVGEPLGRKRP
jgi:hypothetical protein